MIRNLKVLGLAIAAVLAVSAVGASAASAAEFHAEKAPVSVTGSQTTQHKFVTDPGTVTCTTATFSGTQSTVTATDITITPTYEGCTLATIFGNIAVTVAFNGCDYTFTSHVNSETVHLTCPTGKNVTVSGPGCTVTVPAQTVNGVSYDNTGAGTTRDIDVTVASTGLKYSYSGFTCGSGTGTTNGTYSGAATVKGSSGGASVGIWWA